MVFRVDTKPPRVTLVRAGPTTISADGDGVQDKIWVRYRSSESGAPSLTVDGAIASRGGVRSAGQSALSWHGRIGGEAVSSGHYGLSLTVQDRAGNVSEPIGPIDVTVAGASDAPEGG